MLVKVKFKNIIIHTEFATLFLLKHEIERWLPKSQYRFGSGNNIIVEKWLAIEKGLEYSEYIHIPEKIEPKYNQEAINELKY
jgi:hypothetical protein